MGLEMIRNCEGRLPQRALRKSRAANFFKDLDSFIDYCLARYIVWRETRRSNKGEQR